MILYLFRRYWEIFQGRYILITVWSDYHDYQSRSAAEVIIKKIKDMFPQIEVFSIEEHINADLAVDAFDGYWGCCPGYRVKISKNLSLESLKDFCMTLEIDNTGRRILDIDIYDGERILSRGRKVSRKKECLDNLPS